MRQHSTGAVVAGATAHRRAPRRMAATVALVMAATVGFLPLSMTKAIAATVTHTIAQVQGTSASSPLVGATVTVEGIVTGDHRTGGYRGLYIQTAGSGGSTDATPGASDGLFVFLSNNPAAGIAIGDKVSVTGRVSEFNTVTQISASAAGSVQLVEAGVGVPAVTLLPATVLGSAREAFEGMLVRPSGTYRLVSSHNLQSFGEIWTSAGSTMPVDAFETQPPNTLAANAITTSNNNARLLLDDGYSVRVENAAHPGDQPYFTKGTVVRNGDNVTFPAGG